MEIYLIYAIAFGIFEKIIETIKIHCSEVMTQTNFIAYSNYCRLGRFHSYGRNFHSSIRYGSISHSSFSSEVEVLDMAVVDTKHKTITNIR